VHSLLQQQLLLQLLQQQLHASCCCPLVPLRSRGSGCPSSGSLSLLLLRQSLALAAPGL
jgi:hypothetical protein